MTGLEYYGKAHSAHGYAMWQIENFANGLEISLLIYEVKKFLKSREMDCVVDMGAGTGACGFTALRALNFNKCIFVDGSSSMVEFCKQVHCKKDNRFSVVKANLDGSNVPLENTIAQLVVCNALSLYLSSVDTLVLESARLLSPGGVFACNFIVHREEHDRSLKIEDSEVSIYRHSLRHILTFLQKNNMKCISITEPGIPNVMKENLHIFAVKM